MFSDSSLSVQILATSVIVPVVVMTLRSLFAKEISYLSNVVTFYYHRPYDLDHDRTTHDWCMLYNPGDGKWEYASLTYRFSILKTNCGIYVHRYDPDTWQIVSIERIPFYKWNEVQHARIGVQESVPYELQLLIKTQQLQIASDNIQLPFMMPK